MSPPHLLCLGHVTLDRFGNDLLPGGCVTYAALAFSALGGTTALLSRAASDFPRGFFPPPIEAKIFPASATTVFVNRYDEHGHRHQWMESLAEPLGVELLPSAWRNPRLLFLAPVMEEIDAGAWISACVAEMVAAGLQGFLRRVEQGVVVPKLLDPSSAWLEGVDVVFLSDDDCRAQPELPRLLRRRVRTVVLTHQRRGCTVYCGKTEFSLGIHPADEVDPTGAGDTFAAGFLYALSLGRGEREGARLGAACASIIIEGLATSQAARIAKEAPARAAKISD